MFHWKTKGGYRKDHKSDGTPLDDAMGKTGKNFGNDNLGHRNRGHTIRFNGKLNPTMKPETPDGFNLH